MNQKSPTPSVELILSAIWTNKGRSKEENGLKQKYPSYIEYSTQIKKLIP